jgi:hypothetical protein
MIPILLSVSGIISKAISRLSLLAFGLVQMNRALRFTSRMRLEIAGSLVAASLGIVALCTYWEIQLREPSTQMAAAISKVPFKEGVVFVRGTDLYPAMNWNFNDPSSHVLELIDPGPDKREQVAKQLKQPHWMYIYYDSKTQQPVLVQPKHITN